MRLLSFLLFILSFLIVLSLGVKCYAETIVFEWSPEGYDQCMTCTFDLWKNEAVIESDIPKTQTRISITHTQEKAEDDYKLTAKNERQRSDFSRVVRIGDDNTPIITKITQIK